MHMQYIWLNTRTWWAAPFGGGPWARPLGLPLNPALVHPRIMKLNILEQRPSTCSTTRSNEF